MLLAEQREKRTPGGKMPWTKAWWWDRTEDKHKLTFIEHLPCTRWELIFHRLYLIGSSPQPLKVATSLLVLIASSVSGNRSPKLGNLPEASQAENDGAWSQNQICPNPKPSHWVVAALLMFMDHKNYYYDCGMTSSHYEFNATKTEDLLLLCVIT